MNYYQDSKEWKFIFNNLIPWKLIIPLYYTSYPTPDGFNNEEEVIKFFEELISSAGEWCAESVAPRAKLLDEVGAGTVVNGQTIPSNPLKEFYEEATQLGVIGLPISPEFGGLGLPTTLSMLAFTFLSRACLSSATQLGFFTAIADMIERFGTEEHKHKYIPMIVKGEISGCMCLTEPDAGSDLGSIRTTATKQSEGHYLLNGSKCFITNGGGGVAFILARTVGAPEGLKGLSLFFSEEWMDSPSGEKIHNYKITKNEDKMGLHGSFTCEIVYENSKAYLIGEENKGLELMFFLMNEARLTVGVQALGGLEASIAKSRKYATERIQFGKPIIEHPLLKRTIEEMECERDAFRLLMIDTIFNYDIYQKLFLKRKMIGQQNLSKEENDLYKKSSKTVRKRTPLVKYYGAETFNQLSGKAILTLGGYGFMKEYELERIHRDSFATIIYEGTSQIQSLMAVKDLVKDIMQEPMDYILGMFKIDNIPSSKETSPEGNSEDNEWATKIFKNTNYTFKVNLIKLVIKCLKPSGFNQLFDKKAWRTLNGINKLSYHAETICQGLSYLETIEVLSKYSTKEESIHLLLKNYVKLVLPRLSSIYHQWKQ